jgi:hypothetical protein
MGWASIFHRLSLDAVSRLEDSSAPFAQTNDFSSAPISLSQNYSFICKMGSTDQWNQPFLHTKCVECIWKIQQISPALSQMANGTLQSHLANRRENKENICCAKNSNQLANAPVVCSVTEHCPQRYCPLSPVRLYPVPRGTVHCPQRDCTLSPEGLYTVPRGTVHCPQKGCTLSPEGLYPEGLYTVPRRAVHCVKRGCTLFPEELYTVPRGIVHCTQMSCTLSPAGLYNTLHRIVVKLLNTVAKQPMETEILVSPPALFRECCSARHRWGRPQLIATGHIVDSIPVIGINAFRQIAYFNPIFVNISSKA